MPASAVGGNLPCGLGPCMQASTTADYQCPTDPTGKLLIQMALMGKILLATSRGIVRNGIQYNTIYCRKPTIRVIFLQVKPFPAYYL